MNYFLESLHSRAFTDLDRKSDTHPVVPLFHPSQCTLQDIAVVDMQVQTALSICHWRDL